VPRHVARLVKWLVIDYFASRRLVVDYFDYACLRLLRHVAWLIVDYFASHRLVVDYFAYAACPGASARRAARQAACRRLLRLLRASGCLGTSRGSSSTTSTTPRVRLLRHVARLVAQLVVNYFDYAACPVASARRAARRATHRRLLPLVQARHRLL
jgi:hypothetical protein